MAGVDEQSVDLVQEVVAGGAVHRPPRRQPLAARQNLLGDDVQRDARLASLRRPRLGGQILQHLEVPRRIEQAVGMIDADAGDAPFADQPRQQLVDGAKDVGILDAQPGQRVDVEEPAVVDLVRRRPPVREPVGLLLEQIVQRIERCGSPVCR